jgi:aminoglycoside 6'-N-acetyltransferase I
LKEVIRTPGFIGIVLSNSYDGKVVALEAGAFETWYNGKNFQIKELCVDPSLHRHGLGKRVLDAIMADAFGRGATKIYLYTARQSPAEKMYSDNGFKASDEVVMELDLGP